MLADLRSAYLSGTYIPSEITPVESKQLTPWPWSTTCHNREKKSIFKHTRLSQSRPEWEQSKQPQPIISKIF